MASNSSGTADGPVTVETVDEFETTLASDDRVLAYFHADWCGPCQIVEPTVRAVASTVETPVVSVDVDVLPAVAVDNSVRSIPAFVVFENGVAVDRLSGVHEASALRAALEA